MGEKILKKVLDTLDNMSLNEYKKLYSEFEAEYNSFFNNMENLFQENENNIDEIGWSQEEFDVLSTTTKIEPAILEQRAKEFEISNEKNIVRQISFSIYEGDYNIKESKSAKSSQSSKTPEAAAQDYYSRAA